MNTAIHMDRGDLNPHFFYYPTFLMYLLLAVEMGLYVIGRLVGAYPSLDAFDIAYVTNSTPHYLVGHALIALFAAGSVLLCYLIGKRYFSPHVGIIAALLLMVAPVHLSFAHVITTDVPMTFFVLLSQLCLWQVYQRGRRRDYLLAGLIIGLSTALKYLPGVLIVSLALAHLFRIRRETGRWRIWPSLGLLGAAIVLAVLAYLAVSPFTLLDVQGTLRDTLTQFGLESTGGLTTRPINFVPYLEDRLGWSVGWPVFITGLIGLGGILVASGERRRQLILLASFPLIYFLVVGSSHQAWSRYLEPLAPFLALSSAALISWLASKLVTYWQQLAPGARRYTRMLTLGAVVALTLALALLPTVASLSYDAYLSHKDTRTEAADWFTTHVPSGATIAIQTYFNRYYFTAPIMTNKRLQTLEAGIPASLPTVVRAVDQYYRAQPVYVEAPLVYDLATLRAEGVQYVLLSSDSYHSSGNIPMEDRFYADLAQNATLVARFAPSRRLPDEGLYPIEIPTMTIYELPAG